MLSDQPTISIKLAAPEPPKNWRRKDRVHSEDVVLEGGDGTTQDKTQDKAGSKKSAKKTTKATTSNSQNRSTAAKKTTASQLLRPKLLVPADSSTPAAGSAGGGRRLVTGAPDSDDRFGQRQARQTRADLHHHQHHQLHHSFVSDITDVRQMENTLLQLLNDFHSGKLQAFGHDVSFEKMEEVRQQQEKLAKLHFDLNAQQEGFGHQTEEGRRLAKDNMTKLIEKLQQLSNSMYPFRNEMKTPQKN